MLQSDQEVAGITRIFTTVFETQYDDYGWLSKIVSQESNLTWPIAIEFHRAVFSFFKALKKSYWLSLQAFISGSGYHVWMDIKKYTNEKWLLLQAFITGRRGYHVSMEIKNIYQWEMAIATGIYNREKRIPCFNGHKKYIPMRNEIKGLQKSYIRYVSE